MTEIEKLLDEAADKGKLLGRSKSIKGVHYAAFEYNDRVFVGVYTDMNYEYICGAEEISHQIVNKYI